MLWLERFVLFSFPKKAKQLIRASTNNEYGSWLICPSRPRKFFALRAGQRLGRRRHSAVYFCEVPDRLKSFCNVILCFSFVCAPSTVDPILLNPPLLWLLIALNKWRGSYHPWVVTILKLGHVLHILRTLMQGPVWKCIYTELEKQPFESRVWKNTSAVYIHTCMHTVRLRCQRFPQFSFLFTVLFWILWFN